MNRKIDFSAVVLNPIATFADHISAQLENSVNQYLTTKWARVATRQELAQALTKKINEINLFLKQHKKELKINARIFFNGLMMIGFILIIGLVLLPLYLKNQRIIKNFDQQRIEQNTLIHELTKQRFEIISDLFSTITFADAVNFVMADFGILPNDDWSFLNLNHALLVCYPNLVDCKGFSGIIKNTPFYDLVVREHNVRNVTTSMTMAFPYEDYFLDEKGNKIPIVREEILTAYHTEPTPFLDEANLVVYLTNFNPELSFTTNNFKPDREILLENNEFVRDYKLVDLTRNPQKLAEFFTIKSQEDFVNWFRHERGNVFRFSKWPYQLIVSNETHTYLSHWWTNDPISLSALVLDRQEDLDACINRLKNLVCAYFTRLVKMLQIPLLVPGIAREWYQHNGVYLIANSMIQKQLTPRIISVNELIFKFATNPLFTFKFHQKIQRKPWLSHTSSKTTPQCCVHRVSWNSYWSETLVDEVSVVGSKVGVQFIPVSYEKFHQISESKIIFVGLPPNWKNLHVISYIDLKEMIHHDRYQNQILANDFIAKNNIWTNNPSDLEQNLTGQLRNFFDTLNQINQQYKLNLLIQFDQSGTYVIVNDLTHYSPEVEQLIIDCFPSEWISPPATENQCKINTHF